MFEIIYEVDPFVIPWLIPQVLEDMTDHPHPQVFRPRDFTHFSL